MTGEFPQTMPDRNGVQTAQGMAYLLKVPDHVPAGFVVVHNRVQPPAKRLGARGFRAWLALPEALAENVAVCPCKWAPHLETHYVSKPRA
jgi:hypothetical protein